ncbi:MAG: hypothetical protein ACKVWV_15735 [Planctomycetota bacterium]
MSRAASLSIVIALASFGRWSVASAQGGLCRSPRHTVSDAAFDDHLGLAVARSGSTTAVSALNDDDLGANSGSVYVFEDQSGSLVQTAKLHASDGAAGHGFGHAIAMHGDTLVIGAPSVPGPTLAKRGAVYVFVRNGVTWVEQAKLVPTGAGEWSAFGYTVAIDGDTVVAGSPDSAAGLAFVFVRNGSTWAQEAELLTAVPLTFHAHFGTDVAVEGDTAVVGALYENCSGVLNPPPPCGALHVFKRTGTTWSEQVELTEPGAGIWDAFGHRVDISGGRIAATVGGTAIVYREIGGVWTVEARLDGGSFLPSLSMDDDLLALGWPNSAAAPFPRYSGAVNIFRRANTTWSLVGKLRPASLIGGEQFGTAVDVDHGSVVIGAPAANATDGAFYLAHPTPYTAFCFGDGTMPVPCPCAPPDAVPSPSGALLAGCAASFNPGGARLTACGSLSPSDGLQLIAELRADYTNYAFAIRGDVRAVNGIAAGDGLRCVGGSLVRFGGHAGQFGPVGPPTFGNGFWTYPYWNNAQSISSATSQVAGQTAYYQVVYRDSGIGHCNPSAYNLTNGVAVTWP